MSNKILLLSIHPEFANKIFNGTKTAEFRRKRPNLEKNDIVLIYVTSPISALAGKFKVNKVISDTPDDLWRELKSKAGISKRKFYQYYKNSEKAFAILFQEVYRFPKSIKLCMMRKILPNFNPPQSYFYLNRECYIIRLFRELEIDI